MTLSESEFQQVILRYRDEPIPGVFFSPAFERFLDHSYVRSLQEEFRGNKFKWERRVAVPALAGQLPRERGIYMFVWSPGPVFEFAANDDRQEISWILYIGKAGVEGGESDTFQDRYRKAYQKHLGGDPSGLWAGDASGEGREFRLQRFLSLRPLEYWFLPVLDIKYIPVLERRLIRLFRPPLNAQHGGFRARIGKPSPAW
jgi:hypothetical protein